MDCLVISSSFTPSLFPLSHPAEKADFPTISRLFYSLSLSVPPPSKSIDLLSFPTDIDDEKSFMCSSAEFCMGYVVSCPVIYRSMHRTLINAQGNSCASIRRIITIVIIISNLVSCTTLEGDDGFTILSLRMDLLGKGLTFLLRQYGNKQRDRRLVGGIE